MRDLRAHIQPTQGFDPIAAPEAKVLILGTLPGAMSLEMREYYAEPRNCFWKIMEDLFDIACELPYASRSERLAAKGVAVWDVCKAANRPGSLDASIRKGSEEPNDFKSFLWKHRQIKMVCFNGGKAARMYAEKVLPHLPNEFKKVKRETLPSTSGAYAALPYKGKLKAWSVIRGECET